MKQGAILINYARGDVVEKQVNGCFRTYARTHTPAHQITITVYIHLCRSHLLHSHVTVSHFLCL